MKSRMLLESIASGLRIYVLPYYSENCHANSSPLVFPAGADRITRKEA
jgi:hypothetical protein